MAKAKGRKSTRRTGQGSVFQRKDGRWGWAITYGYNEKGNPQRYQGIEASNAEATKKLNEVISKMNLGVPVTEDKQTVGAFFDYWLKEHVRGTKAPKTYRFYEQMTWLYIKPSLGHLQLGKLTPQHVQAFLNAKSKEKRKITKEGPDGSKVEVEIEPLTGNTIGHIRATLRAALNTAWRMSLIRENPALKVTPPKIERKEPVYLTLEEVSSLLAKAKGHYLENLLVVTLHTGLRLGEASGLRWDDIDFEAGTLRVRQQLQRVDGKLVLRDLKTGSSKRTLALTNTAVEALKKQKADQLLWSSVHEGTFNPLGLCFTTTSGNGLDNKTVDKNLKRFAAEIKKPVSFHKLRHTVATHMAASGVQINIVKDQLGHSQIALTANLYSHAVPTALRSAADALERHYDKS